MAKTDIAIYSEIGGELVGEGDMLLEVSGDEDVMVGCADGLITGFPAICTGVALLVLVKWSSL